MLKRKIFSENLRDCFGETRCREKIGVRDRERERQKEKGIQSRGLKREFHREGYIHIFILYFHLIKFYHSYRHNYNRMQLILYFLILNLDSLLLQEKGSLLIIPWS